MPHVKVYGYADRLRERRDRMSDVIHGCVVEAFHYPEDKRAHRFFPMAEEDFIRPADRSEDYTLIEMQLFEGRTLGAKKTLYRLLFAHFEQELGIAPIDLEITLFETPRVNWGLRGVAGDELPLDYRVEV